MTYIDTDMTILRKLFGCIAAAGIVSVPMVLVPYQRQNQPPGEVPTGPRVYEEVKPVLLPPVILKGEDFPENPPTPPKPAPTPPKPAPTPPKPAPTPPKPAPTPPPLREYSVSHDGLVFTVMGVVKPGSTMVTWSPDNEFNRKSYKSARFEAAARALTPQKLAQEATSRGRRAILFFTSKNCTYCLRMEKEVFPQITWNDFEVRFIDTGEPGYKYLVESLGVTSTPAYFLLDPEGRVVQQEKGFRNVRDFLLWVQQAFPQPQAAPPPQPLSAAPQPYYGYIYTGTTCPPGSGYS